MNDYIELQRLLRIVLRRMWLLITISVIAAMTGYMISRILTPIYEATATVLVGQITQSTNLSSEDIQMSELFAQTYADLALRQPVLQGVVEKLELNDTWQDLKKRIQVSFIDNTQLIEIKAVANSPEMARLIADEVANHLILIGPANLSDSVDNFAQSFIHQQLEDTQASILSGQKRIKDIEAIMDNTLSTTRKSELQMEKTTLERLIADYVMNYVELSNLTAQEKKPNSLSVIETAHSENDPIRPRVPFYILLSTGVGFLLALGIIFLWEYLDDAIKSMDDLSQFKELNILGSVGRIRGQKEPERIVTYLKPSSPTTESYRMICNKIRFGLDENLIKSIVVTSPGADEGKSITAINLGITMAQANIKTILVDANFQHPILHQIFNVRINAGLADLITSPETDIDYCLKTTSIDNLRIITNGVSSQNQSERLHVERLSEILKCLEEKADVIIIDSPPALLTVDAMILSNRVDGVVLEIRAGKSKLSEIRQTLKELQEANAHLLGCIYNQFPKDSPFAIYTRHEQGKNLIYHLKTLVNKAH